MNILDLLKADGFTVTRKASTSGGEYASACPWCKGIDRFRVWPEEGRYWCRGCDRKGDAIQYLRDLKHMTFREACISMGREPGVRSEPARSNPPDWQPREIEERSLPWRELMIKFVTWAAENVASDKSGQAAHFLRDERYLQDGTIRSFLLGWNPKEFHIPKDKLGLTEYDRDEIWLPSGIVIPYTAGDGLHRVRIRRFAGEPRYYLCPGSSSAPMLISGPGQVVIVVESDLDALLIHQEAKDMVTVIALGSATIRPDVKTHQTLTKADKVLISLDADEAGAKQSWQWWQTHYPQAKRWPVIRGKDPTEAHANGLDLRQWVLAALPSHNRRDTPPQKPSSNVRVLGEKPPDGHCFSCGSNQFWQMPDGGWRCSSCHPHPHQEAMNLLSSPHHMNRENSGHGVAQLSNPHIYKGVH